MAFYANSFIFDDIPSEFFNLYLGELNGSGESTTSGSNDVSLLTKKLFRRPMPLFFGAEQTPVLQFPLSAYVPGEADAPDYSAVAAWLWGQQNYKVLRICQADMQQVYFNCFLTSPEIVRVGNILRAFTTTVVCDAPWGWKTPSVYTDTYTGYSALETIAYYNESANSFYTYPTELVITANAFGGSISIINQTDSNRQFLLTLSANEVVTMNCDLQIISSSTESYPLSRFNKKWLRFVHGLNTLTVSGNISAISITSPIAVKVG